MVNRQLQVVSTCVSFLIASCAWGDVFVRASINTRDSQSAATTVRDLYEARDYVRRARADGSISRTEEITVWIEPGIYEMPRPLELGDSDGNVCYRAQDGGPVRIVGGKTIPYSSFRRVKDDSVPSGLRDKEALKHVLQANLKELGITDFGRLRRYGHMQPVVCAPLEVFVDDVALPLARYPNQGGIEIGRIIDPGSTPRRRDYSERGGTFEYTDDRHARWQGVKDVWLQGTFHYGYADDNIPIEQIDVKKKQVKLAGEHLYGLATGEPYRKYIAYNLLEELDEPGEWYLDRGTGSIYIWPPRDLSEAAITVSMLEDPIICLEGATGIVLDGLTIECGRGLGIYIEGGMKNVIRNCTIRNVGTLGILMGRGSRQTFPHITHDDYEGEPVSRQVGNLQAHLYKDTTWDRNPGREHAVVNCRIYNTGAGGVYLGGGSKTKLLPGCSQVANCETHDFNRRNRFLCAGINVDGCGNQVKHCEVYGSDFQGIYVRGNDHLFEYNYLHDLARDSDDTSAWYTGRDPSDRGSTIRFNYFENIGRPDRLTMGVYLDDGACGVEVFGNVFYRTASRATVFSNSGHDVKVLNNIFVECEGPAVELNSIWYFMTDEHRASYFGAVPGAREMEPKEQASNAMFSIASEGLFERRLLRLVDIRRPPYSDRYPELTDYMDYLPDGATRRGLRPRGNLMAKNVVYRCGGGLKLTGRFAEFEESNNYITNDDPGFVDVAGQDFALRPDSDVFKVIHDFTPIPFQSIGRRLAPANE